MQVERLDDIGDELEPAEPAQRGDVRQLESHDERVRISAGPDHARGDHHGVRRRRTRGVERIRVTAIPQRPLQGGGEMLKADERQGVRRVTIGAQGRRVAGFRRAHRERRRADEDREALDLLSRETGRVNGLDRDARQESIRARRIEQVGLIGNAVVRHPQRLVEAAHVDRRGGNRPRGQSAHATVDAHPERAGQTHATNDNGGHGAPQARMKSASVLIDVSALRVSLFPSIRLP